jgi:hypothetical protein
LLGAALLIFQHRRIAGLMKVQQKQQAIRSGLEYPKRNQCRMQRTQTWHASCRFNAVPNPMPLLKDETND